MTTRDTKNKVSFVHFNGKETDWLNRINSNGWANSIVFGKVWDNALTTCSLKIYAGKDSIDSSDYLYEIPSLQELVSIESGIKEMQDFFALDASNNFTNESMKDALENFISGSKTVDDIKDELSGVKEYVDAAVELIDSSINKLEDSVSAIEETIDDLIDTVDAMDSSIEDLNSTVKELDSAVKDLDANVTALDSSVKNMDDTVKQLDSSIVNINNIINETLYWVDVIDSSKN